MAFAHFKRSVVILACLSPLTVFAADVNNPEWQIDIAPYIWATSMNGTVSNGPLTAHVNERFSELMQHFDSGGMLWIDAYKGRFGVFVNGLYVDLSDNDTVDESNLKVKTHYGIISGGLSYILLQKNISQDQMIQIEPYIGARYTFNNVSIDDEEVVGTLTSNQGWIDPIIGLRIRHDLNKNWVITMAGDVGGQNTENQYSTNVMGLLGYKPDNKTWKNTTVYLGYRYLYQHYEHGEGENFFEWKMHLYGPVAGINFNLQ